ncbi:radical SAM protein [Pyxidicoccus fallax]|uniref:Radical SAM protein n=1 Tax=Pyxidicoccus fallax TaxID=394095 RepID=A0A848LG05_9BACT|nr:radical SAM/SPASM domain-containing protein [Pyxidicoccus fallax]NMO14638.1 radical SAM protein [Pyxidicoccus fallax]NPC79529.1 radical SAM protein [Pyxidicoccus fallax]
MHPLAKAVAPQGLLGFPSKLQIQTINRCNYTCPMCPYPEVAGGREGVKLDGALFHRLIDEVRAAKRRVKLCLMLQNEPLLDKRFVELLDEAHRAEDAISSISTVTNGSVLTPELLDRLLAYERFFLTVSVNATDAKRYQEIHGKDFWDRVHGLLTGWKGARQRVRLSFVLDAYSVEAGRAFQDYWGGMGYSVRFVPINTRVDSIPGNARIHEFDADYGHCHYPVDTLNMLADGSVILCCNDWKHQDRFGNLREQSIAEVWNSPRLTRLRRAAIDGTLREHAMCKGCDYPIRSSQRLLLEARVAGEALPTAAKTRDVVFHEGAVRTSPDAPPVPVLVWSADEEHGTLSALFPRSHPLPSEVWFQLRIGHSGAFNFGALEPVWCRGTVTSLSTDLDVGDAVPIRINLSRSAEEFQFFRWYCADWHSL